MASIAQLLKCSYSKAKNMLDDLIADGMSIRKERLKKYLFSVDLDEIADYLEAY